MKKLIYLIAMSIYSLIAADAALVMPHRRPAVDVYKVVVPWADVYSSPARTKRITQVLFGELVEISEFSDDAGLVRVKLIWQQRFDSTAGVLKPLEGYIPPDCLQKIDVSTPGKEPSHIYFPDTLDDQALPLGAYFYPGDLDFVSDHTAVIQHDSLASVELNRNNIKDFSFCGHDVMLLRLHKILQCIEGAHIDQSVRTIMRDEAGVMIAPPLHTVLHLVALSVGAIIPLCPNGLYKKYYRKEVHELEPRPDIIFFKVCVCKQSPIEVAIIAENGFVYLQELVDGDLIIKKRLAEEEFAVLMSDDYKRLLRCSYVEGEVVHQVYITRCIFDPLGAFFSDPLVPRG